MLVTIIIWASPIVLSGLIGYYFYKKGIRRRLSIFSLIDSSILGGIETELRSELSVRFKGIEVEHLTQVEVLIANTGTRAISKLHEPLTLPLTKGSSPIDADIIYASGESFKATANKSLVQNGVHNFVFDFPLLNAGEFFIAKLLIANEESVPLRRFVLRGEDLPERIWAEPMLREYLSGGWKVKVANYSPFLLASLFLAAGPVAIFLLFFEDPHLIWIPWDPSTATLATILPTLSITLLGGVYAVMGLVFIAITIWERFTDQRHKFKIPDRIVDRYPSLRN